MKKIQDINTQINELLNKIKKLEEKKEMTSKKSLKDTVIINSEELNISCDDDINFSSKKVKKIKQDIKKMFNVFIYFTDEIGNVVLSKKKLNSNTLKAVFNGNRYF